MVWPGQETCHPARKFFSFSVSEEVNFLSLRFSSGFFRGIKHSVFLFHPLHLAFDISSSKSSFTAADDAESPLKYCTRCTLQFKIFFRQQGGQGLPFPSTSPSQTLLSKPHPLRILSLLSAGFSATLLVGYWLKPKHHSGTARPT